METFRKYITLGGTIVFGGKSADNNEELVKQVKNNEYVLHTASPGSPFCNMKEDAKKVTADDIKETAIFCAKYSQAWKKAKVKKDVLVHVFLGRDIFKEKDMKLGTFGVKKVKKVIVKKQDIIDFEKSLEK